MIDLLRVFLIILLSLSVIATPGLYILEGIFYGFTLGEILTSIILCTSQITLIIVLCATKNIKTLLIFFTINTTIIVILFIIKIIYLNNFVEDGREKFHELILNYPDGKIPDSLNLIAPYIAIKNHKCCGIDSIGILPSKEFAYFYGHFHKNCLGDFTLGPRRSKYSYQGQPCMDIVNDMHKGMIIVNVIKMIYIIFILILFGIYIFLLQRKQNRRPRPWVGEPNNQTVIYPSNTFINNPNDFKPPSYQDISQYQQK